MFARRGGPPDLKISAPLRGTPTPSPPREDAADRERPHTNFLGSGSWTMSALPSCFLERERLRGTLVQLRPKFPPQGVRVPPASVVSAGECRIIVGRHDLWIARGDDRLRVPPEASLYRESGGLTLVFVHGNRAEIRRY